MDVLSLCVKQRNRQQPLARLSPTIVWMLFFSRPTNRRNLFATLPYLQHFRIRMITYDWDFRCELFSFERDLCRQWSLLMADIEKPMNYLISMSFAQMIFFDSNFRYKNSNGYKFGLANDEKWGTRKCWPQSITGELIRCCGDVDFCIN